MAYNHDWLQLWVGLTSLFLGAPELKYTYQYAYPVKLYILEMLAIMAVWKQAHTDTHCIYVYDTLHILAPSVCAV